MIKQYFNFKNTVVQVIKQRTKNYCKQDCGIEEYIESVYMEIQSQVPLDWVCQVVTINGVEITLPDTNIVGTDIATITEVYGDTVDTSVDGKWLPMGYVLKVCDNKYKLASDELARRFDGKELSFIRPKFVDMEDLPLSVLIRLQDAIIEGVVMKVMQSIPSPSTADLAILQANRYDTAVMKLANQMPGVMYTSKGALI